MRTTTIFCDRCGESILENGSIVQAKAGVVLTRHPEALDLCLGCCERFGDWLRSGKEPARLGLGAAIGGLVVESTGVVP